MLGDGIKDYKTISECTIEALDEIVKEHLKAHWALRGDMVVGHARDSITYNQTMVLPDTWVPPIGGGR